MKKVPKNNVDPVLVDVKRPDLNYKHTAGFSEVNLKRNSNFSTDESSGFFGTLMNGFLVAGALGMVLLVGIVFSNLQSTKVTVEREGQQAVQNFFQSIESFKNMSPGEAGESLAQSKENLAAINSSLQEGPSRFAFNFLSSIVPVFKEAGSFLKDITSLNIELLELSENLEDLRLNAFTYFRTNGDKLTDLLSRSRDIIRKIIVDISSVRNKSTSLSSLEQFDGLNTIIQDYHLDYVSDLYQLEDFLGGVLSLLSSDEEKRVLLMFQNSSEIRPAGGFLGSYGEIIIEDGQMSDLVVEDIYWPDHDMNFDLNLIPPEPLQRITDDWGARDANWFFDFPTSAEAVMSLLESSNIYEQKGIRFEGAIALNIEVLGTILDFIGPITIEEYEMQITSDTFLPKLQEEVETGRDKQQGNNPKRILSVLAPQIIDRLESLPASERTKLMELIGDHVADKDVMVYARDSNINSLLEKSSVTGSIYSIPDGFWGSYLAVVNANLAGGKTDAYTKQSIDLNLDVTSDGTTVGDLKIIRTNNGDIRDEPWYNTDNKNYMKVLTPPQSNLIFMEGNDYRQRIVETYPDSYSYYKTVASLEDSRTFLESYNAWETQEFGKKGFAGWLITPPGETESVSLRYETPAREEFFIESGKQFTFVFDDQSGVNSSLDVTINAPVGFVWEESNASVFEYSDKNPHGRVTVELTLQKTDG